MNNKIFPKRKNPRLKDFDYSTLQAYYITICTKDRNDYFKDDVFNRTIIQCLNQEKQRTNFIIYVFCLMPNHIHLLVSPSGDGTSISRFIGGFKSKTTRLAWNFGIKGKLWQQRFYDHILRKKEDLRSIGEYILNNPVRKNLVTNWQDYKYSGYIDYW